MKTLIIALFAISTTVIVDAQLRQTSVIDTGKKVVCVYNSSTFTREGQYNKHMFLTFFLLQNFTNNEKKRKRNLSVTSKEISHCLYLRFVSKVLIVMRLILRGAKLSRNDQRESKTKCSVQQNVLT